MSRTDEMIAYLEEHREFIERWLSGSVQFDWSASVPGFKARLSRYDRGGAKLGVDRRATTA